jgi:hypothetical protein
LNRGIELWLNQIVTLPLALNQQSYLLGPSGNNCSANMGETAIQTAALSEAIDEDGAIEAQQQLQGAPYS